MLGKCSTRELRPQHTRACFVSFNSAKKIAEFLCVSPILLATGDHQMMRE
jgi:hypothetical protein